MLPVRKIGMKTWFDVSPHSKEDSWKMITNSD